jgi:hypothetical protein
MTLKRGFFKVLKKILKGFKKDIQMTLKEDFLKCLKKNLKGYTNVKNIKINSRSCEG